jgi:hypothetical protein
MGGLPGLSLSLDEAAVSDLGRLSFGSLLLRGLDASIRSPAGRGSLPPLDSTLSLEEIALEGLDLRPLYQRALAFSSGLGPENPGRSFDDFYLLQDFFAMPYSLDSASSLGWSLDLGGRVKLFLAEAYYTGPSEAGRIPPSQRHRLEGLRIELPEAADGSSYDKAYEFGRDFGQRVFMIRYDNGSTYDPATGAFIQTAAPLLGVEGLAVINGELGLVGLTPALLEAMGSIPATEPWDVVLHPDFPGLGLSRIRLEIQDVALVDRILAYFGARRGLTLEESRQMAASTARSRFAIADIEDGPALGEAIAGFIASPKSLVLDVSPSQPLNAAAIDAAGTVSGIVNSLNITAAFNGAPPMTFKFVERQPAQGGGDRPPDDLGSPDSVIFE